MVIISLSLSKEAKVLEKQLEDIFNRLKDDENFNHKNYAYDKKNNTLVCRITGKTVPHDLEKIFDIVESSFNEHQNKTKEKNIKKEYNNSDTVKKVQKIINKKNIKIEDKLVDELCNQILSSLSSNRTAPITRSHSNKKDEDEEVVASKKVTKKNNTTAKAKNNNTAIAKYKNLMTDKYYTGLFSVTFDKIENIDDTIKELKDEMALILKELSEKK
ncbi:expressed protein [Dictyostelium purpureum]|uniref:Expressed protein n=1 Tax=Dictyostelium purpureum TaxID=5786 RepID=F0ZQC3_DICPU|nr:uncharacterized protein DICPUDRAFT_92339 [Dictyostelium purpureum]EGC33880.1 expressed protein [Dictyostelium purpureum]|eukprot:XP_003289618.1 expressed protein [Dictyostelium purpureum]